MVAYGVWKHMGNRLGEQVSKTGLEFNYRVALGKLVLLLNRTRLMGRLLIPEYGRNIELRRKGR
jgi:hypothetical protein